MENSNKPTFHPNYKITIDWEQNEIDFYSQTMEGKQTLKKFTLEELENNEKIVISDNDNIIVLKWTRKKDRFSIGILDKSVPEEEQDWVNYLTAKIKENKDDYALFTFDK